MRKNILILGHNYATQFVDIFNQYTRLYDKTKYKVTVAYLVGEPNDTVLQRTIAEEVIFLNLPKKSLRGLKLRAILTLRKFCRRHAFDTVICHRYKPSYIMMWVAQLLSIPHLFFVMHELKTMSAFARRAAIACLQRKNMWFAGVSNAVRDDIRKDLSFIPKDRIITLYNMIDIDHTEPQLLSRDEARNYFHFTEDDFVFGNIARLAKNKDHETLITAFAKIKLHCPRAKLLIIGDGILLSHLESVVVKHDLVNDVIFHGFLPSAFRYMKAFDCFVLSSIQEAFGRVLLEAMVAKLPIIATRVNGIPEVLDQTATLIAACDEAALTHAMQTIYHLSAEERKIQGEKAYQRAQQHFSIPVFQQTYWQLPLA